MEDHKLAAARALRAGSGGTSRQRRRARAEAHLEGVKLEIQRHKADALGRAQNKVATTIAAANEIWALLEVLEEPDAELREAYAAAWQLASQARWELEVHREALGLRDHSDMRRTYPLPPRAS